MEIASNLFFKYFLSDQALAVSLFSDDSGLVNLLAESMVSFDKTIAYSDKTRKTWKIHPTRYMSTAFKLEDTGE